MKILLVGAGDAVGTPVPEWLPLTGSSQRHSIVDDPDQADAILFLFAHLCGVDSSLNAIVGHPLFRRYQAKSYVYDERDSPTCLAPGLYASMPRKYFAPAYQRAVPYALGGQYGDPATHCDLLFSFVGNESHPSRRGILGLEHPRGLIERPDGFVFFDPSSTDFEKRRERFREVLGRSMFVLCPRGRGTSSIRMYEVLGSGRVPVVIADDWVAPEGPRWSSCILRWPERSVDSLPAALEALEGRWSEMASSALRTHETFFSDANRFDYLMDELQSLVEVEAAARFVYVRSRDVNRMQIDARHQLARARVRAGRVKRRLIR